MKPRRTHPIYVKVMRKNLALLLSPTSGELGYITVSRQVVLKAMLKTSVLFSTYAADPLEVILSENIANIHACMTGKSFMEVILGHPFPITVANFDMAGVNFPKHRKVGEVAKYASRNSLH